MPGVMSVWAPELQSDGCRNLPVWPVSRCPILPEWRTGTGLDMSWHSGDRRRGQIVRTHSRSGPRPFSSRHQSLQVQVKKLRPLFTQNNIITSNYYNNTESKLDFFNAVVSSIFIEYQFTCRWVNPRNHMLLFQMNSLLAFSRPYCEQMLNYTITLVCWVRQLHF